MAVCFVATHRPPQTAQQRLCNSGVRMFGAFWRSHCYKKRQAPNAEAMAPAHGTQTPG
ncbi:membrane isoform C [Chlorella sorokiniana]|uniref:Membrane isoform A n=1 Tax=Chlorella sorokiniana TaxID=3076 RepID=A0A2P6TRS0_CHLSO|nr:membrane isoform B [Chlorella sorokiniana]PRW56751.1 membrane isoform A [Chlorella sorokiniana]PRW56752.1 membrane isoform C [Chlorella sorokiniana]|eukprot:PRW56750.1 membrane isoform B [Chlorella sorokiniana]